MLPAIDPREAVKAVGRRSPFPIVPIVSGRELAPRRVGRAPRAVAGLSLGATHLGPLRSAVGGQPVRLGEIADLARLQVWLRARECALRIGSAELIGRQPALAGALINDPPVEELGRDRHLLVVTAGVERDRRQAGQTS